LFKIRGARGLGDSVYVYPIAKYFIDKGKDVAVMTNYPVMYETLKCKCIGRAEGKPDIDCRYGPRYPIQTTNMWEDTLIMAGLEKENIEFKIEYKMPKHPPIFPNYKKHCVIKTPCYPTSKPNKVLEFLIPSMSIYQNIINEFKDQCWFTLLGHNNGYNHGLYNYDVNHSLKNDLHEIMCFIDRSDIVLCQSSYFVSMAEGLNKKVLIAFAQKGLDSPKSYYRWSTPAKVKTKPDTTDCFVDSENIGNIFFKFDKLLHNL
jgi:hypothetical protein